MAKKKPDPKPETEKTVNERLVDEAIRRAILLERAKELEARRVQRFVMTTILPDLVSKVERGLNFRRSERTRLAHISQGVGAVLQEHLGGLATETKARLIEFGAAEAEWQRRALERTVPISFDWQMPTKTLLKSALDESSARGRPMGRPWSEWWSGLGQQARRRVMQQVSIGVAEGEAIDVIARRIRGTRAARFTDGAISTTAREAAALARTGVSHVTSQARRMVAEANKDIIKAERWVATLDTRTTQLCAGLDGKSWDVGTGPYPPAHHQCRSVRVPITKSWKELGINLKDVPEGSRAARQYDDLGRAMSGEVPEGTTYSDWLRTQPMTIQDQVLGKRRAQLFRSGALPIERFTDARGRPLNLAELERLQRQLES